MNYGILLTKWWKLNFLSLLVVNCKTWVNVMSKHLSIWNLSHKLYLTHYDHLGICMDSVKGLLLYYKILNYFQENTRTFYFWLLYVPLTLCTSNLYIITVICVMFSQKWPSQPQKWVYFFNFEFLVYDYHTYHCEKRQLRSFFWQCSSGFLFWPKLLKINNGPGFTIWNIRL